MSVMTPLTKTGYFGKGVCLPFEEGLIDNPLVCHSVTKYLSIEYLKKLALWLNCSFNMLGLVLDKKLAGSNQHAERLTKGVKLKKDAESNAQEDVGWWVLMQGL